MAQIALIDQQMAQAKAGGLLFSLRMKAGPINFGHTDNAKAGAALRPGATLNTILAKI